MEATNANDNFAEYYTTDFDLSNSLNETDYEQFIELLNADNADPIDGFYPHYDSKNFLDRFADSQFDMPMHDMFFDFDVAELDPNCAGLDMLPPDILLGDEENAEVQSSVQMQKGSTSKRSKKATKADRPRTIMSERKRRGRMKEKLYMLRALVPNITKMDKASIIGDAALYVQELQMQAEKLKTEIASLESSSTEANGYREGSIEDVNRMNSARNNPEIKKIIQIDAFQLEEGGFCVRLVCNGGLGITVSLYKALESLSSFKIQSSNLSTAAEDYVLTFTVYLREENKVDVDLADLKFWIASAFLNQGFDFETSGDQPDNHRGQTI